MVETIQRWNKEHWGGFTDWCWLGGTARLPLYKKFDHQFESFNEPITKAKYGIDYLEEDFLKSLEEKNLATNSELFISGENPFLVNVSQGIKTGGELKLPNNNVMLYVLYRFKRVIIGNTHSRLDHLEIQKLGSKEKGVHGLKLTVEVWNFSLIPWRQWTIWCSKRLRLLTFTNFGSKQKCSFQFTLWPSFKNYRRRLIDLTHDKSITLVLRWRLIFLAPSLHWVLI